MYIDKNNGLKCLPTFISYTKWIQNNHLPDNEESIEKYNKMIEEYVSENFYTENFKDKYLKKETINGM